MNKILENDLSQMDFILDKAKEQSIAYLNDLSNRSTSKGVKVDISNHLADDGIGTMKTLQYFNEKFEEIMVSASGPRYWGYVVGGSTPASIVGDWLTSIYDQCPFVIEGSGDTSAQIELETINMLLDLFNLPNDFIGGFVTGATVSNFTSLGVARQWIGKQYNKDFAKDGISESIKVFAATPHSSAVKSLSMLGMGSNNFTRIKVVEGNREAIDIDDLEQHIQQLNGQPFILIASGGTVNTVDFDDFKAIAELKKKYNFWWHIDAAFGAFAACSDEHKHLVEGWEFADSITIDCHKWLNVPYDSAVFFIKEKYKYLQVDTFQNSNAPYLGNPLDNFNYTNLLPENSRRLRALPVWFSLMAYGKTGYKDIVSNSIAMANHFGDFIENSKDFALLAPVRLNTVCFTLKNQEQDNATSVFLKKLNDTGKVFLTPTVYNGSKGIRASFVNFRTTIEDIEIVKELMVELV
ncbi:pyridoxal-dependent decarboxylase [Emticicia oligotrophica]|uniref:pyridoxal phosphate-dependent decarboxylase family protein n=1 Tax=Emticicia oligotrophica TaxID=312279 RepID=UPI00273B7FFA|nr:pyridoxal-dependent decarboxylase [Emticicia oligotrophica]